MTQTSTSPAAQRLDRLAAYLREDPGNPALLADACDAAIASGNHPKAQEYIGAAMRLALDPAAWTFRRARLAIALRQLGEAAQLLDGLLATGGPQPVLTHDLAYVRLLEGDAAACRALLEPWLAPVAAANLPPQLHEALQVLWLRAAHRLQEVDEAMAWIRVRQEGGSLHPLAQGVASLIAFDAGDFETAQVFAQAALAVDPAQREALVASGSLALGRGDTATGARQLGRALERDPDDGRTLSALGFASLQDMDLPLAQSQLERGVAAMPDHVESWHALGWTRLLQGDRDGALAAFRRALEIDPQQADTHAALSLILSMTGDAAQAESHLQAVERLAPDHAIAGYARSVLSGQGKDPAAAQALIGSLMGQSGMSGAALHKALQARLRPPG